jgi:riboflavin kinase/FMN adenylyltransferase
MKIINGIPDTKLTDRHPVVTLGMFDGVHCGHFEVISKTIKEAKERNVQAIAVTFDCHPRGIVSAAPPKMITSLEHRLELFEYLGIDIAIVLEFNEAVSAITGREFVEDILIDRLHMQAVVLGEDAHFGNNRSGNIKLLEEMADEKDFETISVPPVIIDGVRISSTEIRKAVENGDIEKASHFLGRPLGVLGTVEAGAGIGRTLGFPTLNLDLHHELHPSKGVYVTVAIIDGKKWPSVTNIGNRPTIDALNKDDVFIETHILSESVGSLYGKVAKVQFFKKLRDEKKFSSPDELVKQINTDVSNAQNFFETSPEVLEGVF